MPHTVNTRLVEPATTVIEIGGRLHIGNSLTYLETSIKRMVADGSRHVVVDLTGLDFIDSAAIGMLISCGGTMDQAGGAFRIAGAHGTVAKTFDVVHMDRIVPVDADIETSLRNLASKTETA
jgi:anti-sigma B factor antagonist